MEKTCTISTCDKKYLAKSYCSKHYYRAKRGQEVEGRSRFDRRPATINGSIAVIEIASGKGEAIIDSEMVHLGQLNWSLSGDGYPMTYIKGKLVKLHHLVLGKPPKGKVTDHINRNKLDNTKSNLRFVTQRENMRNSSLGANWQ